MPQRFDRLAISKNIVWRDVAGELVLFDEHANRYHGLNEVGSHIWRKIAAGQDIRTIADALAATYDAPREEIADSVAAFVENAVHLNLLMEAAQEHAL